MFHSLASIVFYSALTLESFCFSADLEFAEKLWLEEAKSQLNNPVVIMGHGVEIEKELIMQNSRGENVAKVEKMAAIFGNFYKNREVVFVVCNKSGIIIAAPSNVLFFRAEVWAVPDSKVNIDRDLWPNAKRETDLYVGNAGSIVEAVTSAEIVASN